MFDNIRSVRPPAAWLTAARVTLASAGLAVAGLAVASPALPAQARTISRTPAVQLAAATQGPIKLNLKHWSDQAGFGTRGPAWFKDRFRVVHLQGAVTQVDGSGPSANIIGTLPAAVRPSRNVFTIVDTYGGTYADLEIAKNGTISLIDPRNPAAKSYFVVSLEGISYRPAGSVTPIFLNRPAWIPAGFGAGAPSWYRDGSGVVHLQGAFAPGSPSCLTCVAGRLPQPLWPGREIDTVVHTLAGTYAELVITSDGQFFLVNAQIELVTDLRFVSLEGITFRVAGRTNPIPLGKFWTVSPDPKRRPGWYIDKAGIVHLQGVVSPHIVADPPNLVGTLPPRARPTHNIFTIVLTGAGFYADLKIARNGKLTLIDSQPPAATDHAAVNLDGITYRR